MQKPEERILIKALLRVQGNESDVADHVLLTATSCLDVQGLTEKGKTLLDKHSCGYYAVVPCTTFIQ